MYYVKNINIISIYAYSTSMVLLLNLIFISNSFYDKDEARIYLIHFPYYLSIINSIKLFIFPVSTWSHLYPYLSLYIFVILCFENNIISQLWQIWATFLDSERASPLSFFLFIIFPRYPENYKIILSIHWKKYSIFWLKLK